MNGLLILLTVLGCHRKDDFPSCEWTSSPIAASGLNVVWADTSGAGLAAGEDERLYLRADGAWTALDGPEGESSYRAVSGTATGEIWAITEQHVWLWDGDWTDMTPASGLQLRDLIVRASGQVAVVSDAPEDCDDCERTWFTPSIWRWDGSTWLERAYEPMDGELRALGETTDGRLVAVGDHGTVLVEDVDVLMPEDAGLGDADVDLLDVAPYGDGVVVSGEDGTILLGDPSALTALDTGSDMKLGRVLADSDGQIWALGFEADAEVATRIYWGDTVVWSSSALDAEDGVRALGSPEAGLVWLAGGIGGDRIYEGGEAGFTEAFSLEGLAPTSDLWALDADSAYVVGYGRFGLWDDGLSTAYLEDFDGEVTAVDGGADGEVLAATDDGEVLSLLAGELTEVALDGDVSLRDLSAATDGSVRVVGTHIDPDTETRRAALYGRDDGVWAELDAPTGASTLSAVMNLGAAGVIVAAGEGASTVYLNDGTGWTPLGDSLPGDVYALWGTDASTVYAAVDGDTDQGVWSYNGRNWDPVDPSPPRVQDLVGTGDELLVYGLDEDNEPGIWRYDGRDWYRELVLTDDAAVGHADGAWWVADQDHIYRSTSCE